MSLYCTICRHSVDEGLNQCYNCASGFVAQLACAICNRPVLRGLASCTNPQCNPAPPVPKPLTAELVPASQAQRSTGLAPLLELPSLPGLAERLGAMVPLPERYSAGKHGAQAVITVPANNVISIQHEIQLIALLEAYADEANYRTDLSDLGRRNIRACRLLAIDLKEEVELIKGPQG